MRTYTGKASHIWTLTMASLLSVAAGVGCGGGGGSSKSSSTSTTTTQVTQPALTSFTSPHVSNDTNLVISGTCTSGNTINLTGDDTQSVSCSSGAFSFTVNKSTDTTYNFSIAATDGSTTSAATAVQWTRDTVLPSNPTVTSPGASPYTSDTNTVTIQGACETGATVTITDVAAVGSSNVTCSSSAYSYTTGSKSVDGDYDFQIKQTDPAGNVSGTITWRWTRNTSAVSTPVITNPASSPHSSNVTNFTLAGTCTTGNTINLSGDDTQSVACSGSAFSFTISKATDATYNFSVMASNGSADSSSASQQWIRDTVAPSSPSVDTPADNPYVSGDDSITFSGSCESGATVTVTDVVAATSSNITCSSGTYSYTSAVKTLDNDYDFNVYQTDAASNQSATTTWRWTRNTTIPATPSITSPAVDPHYSNTTSLTISGTCTAGYAVELSGDSVLSTTCAVDNTYSFGVSVTLEGSYSYSVLQNDGLGGPNSSSDTLTWVYDATAPGAPSISSPTAVASGGSGSYISAGDITIGGSCENGATVNLTGSDTMSVTCASSTYAFGVTASCAQSKSFTVAQTDKAGNASGGTALSWTKDCTLMAEPTIVSPATRPHASGSTSLTISGGCDTGMTVVLGGEVTAVQAGGSLEFTCADSAYTFTIDKSVDTQPAIRYDLTLKQQDHPTAPTKVSNDVPLVWIRNGTDQTAVLYHFDAATLDTTDSSLSGGSTLANSGTANVAGKYSQAQDFIPNSTMSAANNNVQRTPRHYMTIETWVNFDIIPGNNGSYVIAEKDNVWKLALTRQGGSSKFYFQFVGAEDLGNGTCGAMTQTKSSTLSLTTGVYRKLAVTFELGSVTIYYNNVAIGTGTIGIAGSSELCDVSPGSLYLGSDSGTADYLDGKLDELSISQKIRDPARTGPFTAD